MTRPKLIDVAKKAGVSATTVSRVINNYGYLSEKTKTKVFAAMEELNYQPNSLARSLHGKATKLIGVIFPTITNPFFAELIEEIEKACFADDYKLILCDAGYNAQKEKNYLKMLQANQVDGIIAGTHNLGIEDYNKSGLPIVAFDRNLSDQVPIVSCDNFSGGRLATSELYQAGCRHIFFLGSANVANNLHPTNSRLKGYLDFIDNVGLTRHVHSVAYSESAAVKKAIIKEILQKHTVDGIVCTDDLTALLVIQISQQMGLQVPQDVKVVGFDGTNFLQTYHPELTTIAQPIPEIAKLLVTLLQERISAPHQPLKQKRYELPVKVIRSTTSM